MADCDEPAGAVDSPRTAAQPDDDPLLGASSEAHLAAVAGRILRADSLDRLSSLERRLLSRAPVDSVSCRVVANVRERIEAGTDPLGDAFLKLRSADVRRESGAVYTPQVIVGSMVAWLSQEPSVGRIVDPGAGSGRFALAAGRAFNEARLVAVESDPLALLLLRANLTAAGLAERSEVVAGDYRLLRLGAAVEQRGPTAFIGNP